MHCILCGVVEAGIMRDPLSQLFSVNIFLGLTVISSSGE